MNCTTEVDALTRTKSKLTESPSPKHRSHADNLRCALSALHFKHRLPIPYENSTVRTGFSAKLPIALPGCGK
jgi:hypothetical protein